MLYTKDEYEEIEERGYNSQSGYVCSDCIEEEYLSEYIIENGEEDECSYCCETKLVVSLEKIIEIVLSGLNSEYDDPRNCVGYCSQEGGWLLHGVKNTWDLLYDHFISGEVIPDIADAIFQTEWIRRNPYSDEKYIELMSIWETFSNQVKHQIRYFFIQNNKKVQENPDDDLYLINEPTISEPYEILRFIGENVSELELVKEIPKGTIIYRARETNNDQVFTLARDLGAPPIEKTINAYRMSPAGISMFYGALDTKTCIEEIKRENFQDFYYTISKWETIKQLNILDLNNLPEVPSIFDENKRWYRTPIIFLYEFIEDFQKPILKDGKEHIEYVPTQIVTEYFRHMYYFDYYKQIHGIYYPSSKCHGTSCVLFCGSEGCCDKNEEIEKSTLLRLINVQCIHDTTQE